MIRFLPLIFLVGACNPLVGVSSFVHSMATGNTVGMVTGGAGVAVEHTTGKSISEHVIDELKTKEKEPKMGKRIEWIFIE